MSSINFISTTINRQRALNIIKQQIVASRQNVVASRQNVVASRPVIYVPEPVIYEPKTILKSVGYSTPVEYVHVPHDVPHEDQVIVLKPIN